MWIWIGVLCFLVFQGFAAGMTYISERKVTGHDLTGPKIHFRGKAAIFFGIGYLLQGMLLTPILLCCLITRNVADTVNYVIVIVVVVQISASIVAGMIERKQNPQERKAKSKLGNLFLRD
jgi:hypothetical protein